MNDYPGSPLRNHYEIPKRKSPGWDKPRKSVTLILNELLRNDHGNTNQEAARRQCLVTRYFHQNIARGIPISGQGASNNNEHVTRPSHPFLWQQLIDWTKAIVYQPGILCGHCRINKGLAVARPLRYSTSTDPALQPAELRELTLCIYVAKGTQYLIYDYHSHYVISD